MLAVEEESTEDAKGDRADGEFDRPDQELPATRLWDGRRCGPGRDRPSAGSAPSPIRAEDVRPEPYRGHETGLGQKNPQGSDARGHGNHDAHGRRDRRAERLKGGRQERDETECQKQSCPVVEAAPAQDARGRRYDQGHEDHRDVDDELVVGPEQRDHHVLGARRLEGDDETPDAHDQRGGPGNQPREKFAGGNSHAAGDRARNAGL